MKVCLEYFTIRRIPAIRINQRPVQKADGSWCSPGADRDAPDLMACFRGRTVCVECKTGRAEMTPGQHASAARWAAAGAIVVLARSVSDLDAALSDG